MSCKEASPEAIGAIGKYCVVASSQDSEVSTLVNGTCRKGRIDDMCLIMECDGGEELVSI